MIKLTITQLALLAAADGRKDGALTRPSSFRSAIAIKLASKLIEQGLVREVRAKADLPVWREDTEGKRFSLTLLKAGRAAVRAMAGQGGSDAPAGVEQHAATIVDTSQQLAEALAPGRPGSKRALIVGLLQRPDGVTIKDLMAATGWLPHTTRAALTGLRKAGLAIDRRRDGESQDSVYRLAPPATAEAA